MIVPVHATNCIFYVSGNVKRLFLLAKRPYAVRKLKTKQYARGYGGLTLIYFEAQGRELSADAASVFY